MGSADSPLVFSVQHFCLHDGPGIRSTVFLKGCPLRCQWCQNPESWHAAAELAHKSHLCVHCNKCVQVCPERIITKPGAWDVARCTLCFDCVQRCPSGAMVGFGEARSVDSLIEELEKEYSLFKTSGGGVTFSGGEATMFPQFLSELAGRIKDSGIHVAVETCGYFHFRHPDAWDRFAQQPLWRLFSRVNLVLFDLKIVDDAQHKLHCGADNTRIKENFLLLAELFKRGLGPEIWPRMPLIPTMTDDTDNLVSIAQLIQQAGLSSITLVPFHNLGESKREWLKIPAGLDEKMLSDDALDNARELFLREGITCFCPGEETVARSAL